MQYFWAYTRISFGNNEQDAGLNRVESIKYGRVNEYCALNNFTSYLRRSQ